LSETNDSESEEEEISEPETVDDSESEEDIPDIGGDND
jgi:hypothetical protein